MQPDPINSVLIAYKLIAPHTRIISPQYINNEENFGNPSLAGKNVAEAIRKELTDLGGVDSPVTQAIAHFKNDKNKSYVDNLKGKYEYLKPFLRRMTQT